MKEWRIAGEAVGHVTPRRTFHTHVVVNYVNKKCHISFYTAAVGVGRTYSSHGTNMKKFTSWHGTTDNVIARQVQQRWRGRLVYSGPVLHSAVRAATSVHTPRQSRRCRAYCVGGSGRERRQKYAFWWMEG